MLFMSERPIFTYQTRLRITESEAASLDAYAALFGRVERSFFAAKQAGGELNELKRTFCKRFGASSQLRRMVTLRDDLFV